MLLIWDKDAYQESGGLGVCHQVMSTIVGVSAIKIPNKNSHPKLKLHSSFIISWSGGSQTRVDNAPGSPGGEQGQLQDLRGAEGLLR